MTSSSIPLGRSGSGRVRGARCGGGSPIASAARRSPTAASTSSGWSRSRCWRTRTGSPRSSRARARCGRTRSRIRTRARRVDRASVWFTAYPLSFVTRTGETYLSALADRRLWDAFRKIGIDALHTGPVKRPAASTGAGSRRRSTATSTASACRSTPSSGPRRSSGCSAPPPRSTRARSSTTSSPATPARARTSASPRWATATTPASTTWSRSRPSTGTCCPTCRRTATASTSTSRPRRRSSALGYIIGRLQRVIFYEPGIKETNWSATRTVTGVDGVERRWVYLHYFKEGQPSHQLARPVLLRHAARDRRCAARARRPRRRRAAARRQRLPRRREVGRGGARVVGGPSALARPPTT